MTEPSEALPDSLVQIGSIHIAAVMGEHGTGTSFTYDDLSIEAAIGHLTIVLDRLKEEAAAKWDHCPGCGEPFKPEDEED